MSVDTTTAVTTTTTTVESMTVNAAELLKKLEKWANIYNECLPFDGISVNTDPVELQKTPGASEALELAYQSGFNNVCAFLVGTEEYLQDIKKSLNAALLKEHVQGKNPNELFSDPLIKQVSINGGDKTPFTVKSVKKQFGVKRLVRLYSDLRPAGSHELPDVSETLKSLQKLFEGMVTKAVVDGTIPSTGNAKKKIEGLLTALRLEGVHCNSANVEALRHVITKPGEGGVEELKIVSESAFDGLIAREIACMITGKAHTVKSGVKAK